MNDTISLEERLSNALKKANLPIVKIEKDDEGNLIFSGNSADIDDVKDWVKNG